jgi:S1-C subfamily serine protease
MRAISDLPPMASARLGIIRDGEPSELSVKLGERPSP